ncbi:NACHT and WD repeat domain-containing protein 2 [Mastacembelus armatus]|uniref:NACHT and WD repeat domain-containing protein 2 n=1 Tax=Mastacembelus armatus TaxID=205130 RepID=UPI000E453F04|nr:NACHT and WD repeat domain-containing protein 2-like [Mastacembelus armatus]
MDQSPSNSPCSSSCVKLYLCSNPEDSIVERRALRENVFPKLREHCRHTLGLDVRVIDPFESSDPSRWPDVNTRQQLMKECRESSAGPFLLALIGHQYGTASLPTQVEVSEYQLLLQECQQVGVSTRELERVYQREENTIPPSYCLRPPHRYSCCTQVLTLSEIKEEEEVKVKAEEEELRKLFQTSVSMCVHSGLMTPERGHSYYRSALDADLRFALDNRPDTDIARHCLIYINKVVNAIGERDKNSQLQLLSQSEAATSELLAPTDGQLLSELCDNFLPGLITSCQLVVYTTTTECDRRHGYTTARRRCYAESLCQQVYTDLVVLIDSMNALRPRADSHLGDALAREQAEQEELCDILHRFYEVHRPEEKKVRAYVEQNGQGRPLVVTGGPCTGKTVLLAHCAQQIKTWLPDRNHVVITFFCSLSNNTSAKHLLSNLCSQISSQYHSDSFPKHDPKFFLGTNPDDPGCTTNSRDYKATCSNTTTLEHVSDSNINLCTVPWPDSRGPISGTIKPDISLSELKERFSTILSLLPFPRRTLVLLLDGLDQLENNFGLQIIESLPSPLPPGVKLILTVSSNQTQVLQAIKLHYPQCNPPQCVSKDSETKSGYDCVQLGLADRKQCVKMLASLLSSSGRRVTSGQQALVNQALTSCGLTLYAQLLHVHTSLWRSDLDVTGSSLPNGVHSSISALLDHLEQKHGSSIVARAVSYLTLSRTGLTEAEFVDLLSSDDEVLAEYVQRGETPSSSMRVPQIDVERVLLDLRRFLIRRTVAGSHVLFWMSRHFQLVVAKRYLGTHEARMEIHSEMADYFSGRWGGGSAKPLFVNQKSEPNKDTAEMKIYIDRQLPSQPFVFTSSPKDIGQVNLRKVVELPYHLQRSDRWEELEDKLLMSLRFHQAMVQAGLLWDLVAILEGEESSSQVLLSRERLLLASTLKASACLLQSAPLQLPTVMEADLLPYLEVFPALEGYVREISQERRMRGSGLGLTLCPAPSSVPSIQFLQCNSKPEDVSVTEAAVTECGVVAEIMDDGSAWIWKSYAHGVVQLSLSCEQKELKFAGVKSSGQFMLLSTHCNKLFLWDVTGPEMFLEVKDTLKTEFESIQQTLNKVEGFVARRKLFIWWKGESFVSVFDVSSETLTHFHCLSSVTCLVCSSNGFYMYCGQEEGTVSVFDIETSSLLGTCSNPNHSAVALIILSEDKREMACVDKLGNITLWDVAAQPPRLIKESYTGCKANILNIDYTEESDTLLVCQSQQVTMWDTCDWELWDQFFAPQDRAFSQAVLSQDGHLFLALLDTCTFVLVWRVNTGECILSLETNKQPHTLLKMASDVICITSDGCLTVWDSGMIAAAGTALKMGCGVREVVAEQTGEWFYTSDGSEAVWRWNLEKGFPHAKFLHDGPVEKLRLSPNSIHLVSLSAGEIYVWQTESGQNMLRISGSRATDILITPKSNCGVCVSERGLSRVWNLTRGSIVCSINLYLSDAQVSPESTFLIGHHRGDLLAASLWSGSISKRFSCVESSECVVAFHTLPEFPDFVVVMAASGAVYTWNIAEETVCRHFHLPHMFHCQPRDFHIASTGSYALLSTDNDALNLLDLCQLRLYSLKTEGPVVKVCLGKTGDYAFYICRTTNLEKSGVCYQHSRPVLTVVRLADGERVGRVHLCKNPLTLVVSEQRVFVGFNDGSVGVYSFSDGIISGDESIRCRDNLNNLLKQCPFDRASLRWPLATPNIKWP